MFLEHRSKTLLKDDVNIQNWMNSTIDDMSTPRYSGHTFEEYKALNECTLKHLSENDYINKIYKSFFSLPIQDIELLKEGDQVLFQPPTENYSSNSKAPAKQLKDQVYERVGEIPDKDFESMVQLLTYAFEQDLSGKGTRRDRERVYRTLRVMSDPVQISPSSSKDECTDALILTVVDKVLALINIVIASRNQKLISVRNYRILKSKRKVHFEDHECNPNADIAILLVPKSVNPNNLKKIQMKGKIVALIEMESYSDAINGDISPDIRRKETMDKGFIQSLAVGLRYWVISNVASLTIVELEDEKISGIKNDSPVKYLSTTFDHETKRINMAKFLASRIFYCLQN